MKFGCSPKPNARDSPPLPQPSPGICANCVRYLAPKDVIDEILIADYTELSWEVWRLRQAKTKCIRIPARFRLATGSPSCRGRRCPFPTLSAYALADGSRNAQAGKAG